MIRETHLEYEVRNFMIDQEILKVLEIRGKQTNREFIWGNIRHKFIWQSHVHVTFCRQKTENFNKLQHFELRQF